MRWTLLPKPAIAEIEALALALNAEPLVAHLLLQRGITTYEEAKEFFRPSLSALHDPFLMQDMDKAVARIEAALEKGENILVYGDYDVDGTTAVALLTSYLLRRTPHVATYIPDRYTEGYGISYKGIDYADDNNIQLIIALDCGIKALKQVSYARDKGIDFIICDHHRPGTELPGAVAVLDPKRDDCQYPYKELCGCGLGFKLVQALASREGEEVASLTPYLDLVAAAIGADIVPVTGENRILAAYGLQQINSNPRAGFRAIMSLFNKTEFSTTDVVFIIAPRINAAGRMEHGLRAVELLMETELGRACELALEIEEFNKARKELDRDITQQAIRQIQENGEENRFTSVVYDENWHKGVIGIVASRLTETYYRPTLVFTKSGETLAASARSVKGFDVYAALEGCADCLEQFGGHTYAAGLTLQESSYEEFKARFEKVVAESIDPSLLSPEIKIDSEIRLSGITPRLLRILRQFSPFGPGNMVPVFLAEKLQDTGRARTLGQDNAHLKLAVVQNGVGPVDAIGFGLGPKLPLVRKGTDFDAVFTLDTNEWNGNTTLQLKLRDLR